MGLLGDLGGVVVADVRIERGDQHQAFLHQFVDARGVGLEAGDAMLREALDPLGQKLGRVNEVVDDQRLEDVELEVAAGSADVHRHIVTQHLGADHCQRLALGRIDFARHDRAAGFVLRDADFAQAGSRTGGEPAHVVGDLHQRAGERLERAVSEDQRVMAGQRLELVRSADEGLVRERGDLRRSFVGELGMGVQPSAHSRAAEGELVKMGQGHGDAL